MNSSVIELMALFLGSFAISYYGGWKASLGLILIMITVLVWIKGQ